MNVADFVRPTVIGVALWAIGVAVIRWLPMGFDGGGAQALTYALSVPTGWLSVDMIARIGSGAATDPLLLTVQASIIGLVLNGLALGFAPAFYQGAGGQPIFGAAWLFWMLAVILFFASRRRA